MRTVPGLRVIGAVLAAAALQLGFSAPAHAVEGTFVSNNGRSSDAAFNISSNQYAQGFTTGDNSGGYVLTSVEVNLAAGAGSGTLTATVRSSSSNNPGTTLCTLNTPNNLGSGVRKFSAPATCANLTGNTLSASTNYFVVMTSGGGGTATWRATASDAEDDSGATDWVIRDDRLVLVNNQWGSDTGTTYAYKIKINAENTAPTGADSEVTTHENENYAFEGGDFNFQDADDHRLDHVKITSLPGTGGGTLSLNGADITSTPQEVTAAQLDDGDLKYNPPTDASSDVFTTFQFKVSDGYEDSASTYTFTLKNDGPTIIGPDEISWPENKPANYEVGSYPITAPGNFGLTFAVSGDDADDFDVLETTQAGGGKALSVTFDSSPDAEDPDDADTDNVYEFTLEVTANSLTDTLDVTVTVTDVNEFDPTVTGLATVDYAENGTDAIATYTIADADVSDTVSVSALTGDDASQFSRTTTDNNDGTVTAELNFIAAPDFEAPTDSGGDNDYEVTLSGSDGSNTTDLDITVTVTGVNDNNPTLTGPTTLTVAENTPTTTVIATYMATDADGDVITFELGGGSGSGADRYDFIIDGNTGVVTFANPPDFETPADLDTNNVYEIIMRALDGSPTDPDTNYSLGLNVTVTVTDLPAVSGLTAVQYAENGTAAVDTYTATDADGQAVSVTWSLEGDDSGDFTISGGALSFASSPDHESATDDNTDNEYNVTVVATDGSEPGRLNVTVDVTNVNEAPTFNEGTSTTRNIDENSAAGTNVGSRVIATDQDGDTLTYSLSGTDEDAFDIDGSTGQLSVASGVTIDYETKNSYSVTVSVRDSKDASGTADTAIDATIAVTVTVTDVNDAPTFNDGTSTTRNIDENATGDIGGAVGATDQDGDTLTYSLSGTDVSSFDIDSTDGQLSVATGVTIDYETKDTYTVTVSVRDSLDAGGTADTATDNTITVTINVRAVTVSETSVTVTEASGAGQTATYTVKLGTQPTGDVTVTPSSDATGVATVSPTTLTFTTTNWSTTQTVTVTGVDDAIDNDGRTATISHTVAGADYGSVTAPDVAVALTDDDATPAVDLSVSPTSVDEGDGATTVTVTATLNPTTVTFPADTAVTVSVTDSNTSGVVGFTAVSDITVTIASGATSGTGTFTLTPEDDAVDEADETVTVSGSSGTLTVNATTLALTDDDATPAVDLSVSPTSVDEGDGATTVTVTATLNPTTVTFPADTAVTVSVTDSNTSGVVGFTAVSDITVTIASGATSGTGTFTLTPEDDAVDEADETVTVSGSSGTLTVNATTLALTDDDATPAVDLSVSPTSVDEGDGATTVTVTATLNPTTVTFPADTAVTVSVTDSNTSGVVGFTAVSDITVTIASGATSGTGTFTLTPEDDAVDEADETVTVSGSSGTLTVNETTLALTDDDATPAVDLSVSPTSVDEGDGATTVTVTATLNPTTVTFPADTAVTVSVTDSNTSGVVGFTAVSDITVTIASGATSGTGRFTLTPEDDAVDEADETVTVSGSSGTLTVNATTLALTDDDATPAVDLSVSPTSVDEGDGATTVTVTATLNPTTVTFPADTAVTVSVTDSNTSGVVGFTAVSDITVTIASGATSGTGTFTLTPADDAVDEADETMTVSGSSGTLTVNETTLALTDDDATPAVDLSVSPTSVDEGDGATTVTVTATLNPTTVTFPADTAVTVSVTDSNTSGVVGFTAVSDITVTIASGATSGTGRFTLTPADDAVDEADETVTVSGSSGTLMVNETTLALTDDDATPAVDLSVSPTSVAEGAGATTVTVTATLNPTTVTFPAATAVTVSVAGTLGDTAVGFATVSDFTITIPAATATATGTFTLTPTNDAVDEIDEVIDVTGESGSLTITKASIDLTDDDDAPTGITLTLTDASNAALSTVAENVATAPTITVTAAVNGSTTYPSATAVTVSVAGTLGDTAVGFATVSDFTITIPAATATATGTFTLTPTNDAVDEIDEVIDVTGESGSLTITKASIDLTDDDDAPTGITLTLTDASNVALSTVAENVATAPTITVTAAVNGSTTYPSATAVTVSVAGTLGDTAVGFATVSDFTITIPAATATATGTFTLTPTNDAVDEIDEVIDVTGESGSLTITKASIDLTDDDDAPTGITLTLTDASNAALSTVAENVATAPAITVTAAVNGSTTYPSATAVTVSVAGTLGDTAVGFATVSDFTITIPAATATATGTFTLTPTNDAVDEIDEVIDVTGESGSLTITKASIDLTDDDDAPTGITLTLTDASNAALSTVAENVATAPAITVTAAVNGSTTYASATAVTVSVAGTLGDTAVGFATVSDFTITIPAATATATGTFTLTPTNDAVDEIDEVIDVTGESGSLTITKASIDLTDDDDAPTGITLTLTDASNAALSTVAENVATAPAITVTAAVNGSTTYPSATAVTVSVAGTLGDTAVGFATVSDFTITIPAATATATGTFTLTPTNDAVDEIDEVIDVTGESGSLTITKASIDLTDDDDAPTGITLTLTDASNAALSTVAENVATAPAITVTAAVNGSTTYPSATAVTVSVAGTLGDTAVGFATVSDFTITIPAATATATGTFTLTPTNDAVDEIDEVIDVTGESGSLTITKASIDLTDDDDAPTGITLTLTDASNAALSTVAENVATAPAITVTAAVNGSTTYPSATAVTVSVAGTLGDTAVGFATVSDFTITIPAATATATGTFTLTPTNDAVDEIDEVIDVTGESGSLTITKASIDLTDDDDAPTGITLTLTDASNAALSTVAENVATAPAITVTAAVNGSTTYPSATAVTVSVAGTLGDTAVGFATVSDFTITIPAATATATGTFTLTPTNDAVDEIDEVIDVTGESGSLTITKASIDLTDDDDAPTGITLTLTDASNVALSTVAENVATAPTITVTAAVNGSTTYASATAVTVSVAGTLGDTAVGFATVSDFTITIPAATATATGTFTLTPTNDAVDEIDEVIDVTGESGSLTITKASIDLTDDDDAPTGITLTLTDASNVALSTVAENVATAPTITVTAAVNGSTTYASATAVTVSVAGTLGDTAVGFATVSDFTITIPAATATATGTFTLTPTNDAVDEIDEVIDVTGESGSLTITKASIDLTDDDDAPAGITLTVDPTSVAEEADATDVTVTATVNGTTTYAAEQTVTVAVGAEDDAAKEETDYALVADITIAIPAGGVSATGTFSLDPTGDVIDEGDGETLSVEGSAASGVSVTGAGVTITDNDVAPSAPVNFQATPGDAQVTLSWTDPGDATIDNYQVSSDGGTSFADIPGSGATTTSHIVTGLTNGTAYTLALRAVNGSGDGAVSSIAATPVAVPAAPLGLTAAAGDAQATLSWTDPGNDTITGYELRVDSGAWADIAGSDADTASHTVTGLTNGTAYSFALRAVNASGDGAVSSIAATPVAAVAGVPAAPVGLSATPGDAQVTLSWTDPGDATIDNYQVSSDGGTSFADIPGSGATTTSHIVTGLTNGTAYTLALRAVNGSGDGAVSSIAATPVAVPSAPLGLTAAAGDAQATLSWTDPGNDTITGYELRVDSGAWADIPGSDADTASHTVTGLTNGTAYSFALRAVNASGDGAVSSIAATPVAAVAGVPAAPVGLSATPGDAQVTLSWTDPGDATIDNYQVSSDGGTSFADIPGSGATTTSHIVTGLTNGTAYTLALRAVNGSGNGAVSSIAATPVAVPAAPLGLTAAAGDAQATLSWTDPGNDTITGYELRVDSGAWADIPGSDADTASHTVTGLTNGTAYSFALRAVNASGDGAVSSIAATPRAAVAGVPAAPVGLSATPGDAQVTLSWTDPGDATIDNYQVSSDGGTSFADIPGSGATTTSHIVTGLTNGTAYTLALRAVNGSGNGAVSSIAATPVAVPAAPLGLTAAAGDAQATLSWTDPGNDTITGYELRVDSGAWADIAGSDADTASHTVTGLTNGTAYSFALRAVNASGDGAVSSIAATPVAAVAGVPAAPVGLSATPGDAQVTLSWTDPGDATITNYQVSSDGGTSFADIPGSGATTTSHIVTGLTNGTAYTLALRAVNGSGNGAVSSIAATPVAVPAAPLGLTAAAGDAQATLSWTDPGNDTITGYELRVDSGAWADIAGSDADTASHTVTGLTNGTAYSFALRAVNASGDGAVSSIAATPVAAVAGVPAAPVGLSATPGDAQVTLSWTDPGDATIDNYQVSSDGGTSFADIPGSGATTTSHIVTGLTNGTAYTLALRAVNGSGNGAVSSIAATPVAVPAAPLGLTAAAGDAQATLSWTDPGNDTITGYELRVDSGAWADIPGSDADTASHTVTGLTNGTAYSFALRAVNASGDGAVSSIAATPVAAVAGVPAAPVGLSATPGDAQVTLSWTDPGDATIDNYQVSSDGGTSFADIPGSGATTTSHIVTGLTNGTAYTLALRAVNGSGNGAVSSIAATPVAVPAAPLGLTAAAGDAQATLSWTDPGNDTITGYELRVDSGAWADIPGSDADTASHTVTGLTNGTAYSFALRAVNASGDGAVSSIAATPVAAVAGVPAAPVGLSATPGDAQVTLSWTDPGDATIDNYQVSSDGGTSFADIPGSGATTTSHIVTGLTNGTAYTLALRAVNGSGNGAVSSIAATPVAVPSAPLGLTAAAGDAQATLSWTDPGNDTITGYELRVDSGAWADIPGSDADTASHTVTGLTNGTAYSFALRAVNASGDGAVSSIAATPVAAVAGVPAAPVGLSATPGDAQVTLSWTDPGDATITNYQVSSDGGTSFADIPGSGATTTSHIVTGLTNGTAYTLALRAVNGSGNGAVSSIAATPVAVPAAPLGLTAAAGDAQATLSWTDPGNDTITGYELRVDSGAWADIPGSDADTASHTVTGLTNGTAYSFALRAVNASGDGAVSSIAATPVAAVAGVPAAPVGLSATPGDAQVTLSWTDPGDATIDNYQVSSDGGTSFADIPGSGATTTSHIVTGLTNGTAYTLALRAVNGSGNGAVSSIAATPVAVPAAPLGLTAAAGDAQATLSWTDPGNDTITGYELRVDSGAWADIPGSDADTASHTVTGLTNGTAYSFALRAVNASGDGAVSSIAATPRAAVAGVPAAPVGLSATPGDAQVTLSWTDPGDATITNYQVSSDGGTSFADIPGSGATTTSHIVTGLTNGTAYTLALRAVNGSGNGAVSSIAATPVAVPAAPLGLTAAAGDAQATLSWTDPGNDTITGYELRVDSGAWADIPGSDADTASHTVTGLTNGTAYSFALRAVNASGDGAVSSIAATPVAAVAGVPAAPVGLSATPGDAQVTLSWTDPGDATIDNYQVSSDGGTSFADIPGSGATTTSHIVTGLTNGTAYTLALRAVNGSGNGAVSSIAATPVAVPAAPLGLTAAAGDAQATLSWTDPGNDTITGYELRVDSGAWADIPGSDADTASHTVTGLTNGTAYSFALRAVNASGDGAVSSIAATPRAAVAGVPAAPVGLSATPGDAQVTLSWTDPGDATIDNYQVSSDGGTSFADIPGSGATTTSHIVTGLTNGTAYTLALRAVNGSGNGAVSSIAATPVAVPAAPLGLTAAAGDAQATLSWTDPGNDTITGYELRVDSGAWADIAGSDADTASHTVTGLTNGTAYSFALRAVNASGDGAVSSIAATPVAAVAGVPAAPVGLSATPGDAQVTLSWTDPGDATIDNYQVSSDGGTSFADIPGSGATTTSHIVTGLTNGTAYTLALRAVNGSGNGAVSSIAATPVAVPSAPLGLTAAAGDAQATLSWTDPGNDTITGYELRVDSGAWADIPGSDADTASHTVTGLTNGTAYSFALRAVNASGDGAVSSIAATPVAAVAGVPAAPVGLSATPGDAQVTLSWTDPGDATIDNYQVSSDGGTSFADIPGSGATTTSHIVTGLTNGTAYTLALRAVNGSGNGAVSSIAATPVAVPAAPLGLTAAAGDAQATLSWTDPGNDTITGYELRVDSGAWADIPGSDADTASHTVTGLTNGTAYSFALRAVNASGDGAVSSIAATPRAAVAGVPAAPVGLSATPGDAQVTLSWTDPGDATITNYQVSSDGGTSFADIPGSGATTTSHIVTGLTNGTAYTLALRAVNGSGNGAVSSIAATPVAVPAAPLDFQATAGDARVTLTWNTADDDSILRWEYRQREGTGDYGAWTAIDGSHPGTTAHAVEPLVNGTAYTFRVRAVNATGNGASSGGQSATPTAGNNPPTVQNPLADLTLVAGATQDVDVSGTFDDHDDDALTYTASSDDTSVATVSLSGTTLTVSGVAAGATTVTVSASDSSASASDTFAVTVETDTQPGLAAIADQSYTRGGEIAALTLPSSSTGNGPLTYSLSPALPAGLSFDTTTRTLSGTPTGLQASTSYTYKVVDANEDEATQSFNITVLAPVAAAVAVSETALAVAEPAGLATYTVVLTSQPTGTVTVMPSSSDTLMARVSPTPLRFTTSNWSMTQTVTVTAVDDDLVNASDRSVSITHTAASTDTNYDLSSDNLGSVAVTVTDDDMASDSIVLSVEPKSVGEGDGATPVPVTAAFPEGSSRLSSRTIVTVQVTGNTASADDFVAVRDFTVTIEAMALSGTGTFTLTPISDVLMEGDETVTVSGTAAGGFTVTGTEVTIVDDVRGATQDRTAVNREVLPLVTQAMAASTATAVRERIDAVTSGVGQVPSYNLASHQTLAGVLQTVSDGLRDGTLTVERLLGGSSFVLPLHATNNGQQTGLGNLAIWGKGDYRNLGGGEAIDWDGEIFSGHLGVDTRLSADLLAGLAASWSKGSFDYAGLSGTNPVGGSYTSRMTSVHPYVNWSSPAGVDLWGSLGYGWGELAIAMQGEPQTEVSDTTMQTATVGANGKVLSMAGLLPGGTTILRLKGEALLTNIKVEGNGDGGAIEPLSLEARRFRLALEGLHEHEMASGGRLVPAVEIGVRHDGGDGLAGTGLELGGGLRYVDPTIGLTIDGRGRALVTYGAQEYREWGASLFIQLDPGADGQGLSFNVMPAYGQTASGVTRLWDQGLDGVGTSPSEASARLEAVVGYGLPTLEGTGLVTPYSGVTLSSGGHRLRLGSTLAVGSSFNVSLEGTQAMRSEATSREATPVYGVRLQADWQF